MLIVLVVAFILLRPRLWVKNKTARVIVDGRLSEDVKLFHGSDGRVLFYLKDDSLGPYIYESLNGVKGCDESLFVNLKLIIFSRQAIPYCADYYGDAKVGLQSLKFHRHGQDIVISWQAAPR
jgi:hypothetical protein